MRPSRMIYHYMQETDKGIVYNSRMLQDINNDIKNRNKRIAITSYVRYVELRNPDLYLRVKPKGFLGLIKVCSV